ncbi:MAG TPA: branched-chain amino acid ABC transporter permease [Chloroflexota bacterium]
MWHEQLAQILLIGITNGLLIALVALGYTLVYGIIELINFAHGDVFMIGTMVSLTIVTSVPAMMGIAQPETLTPPLLGLLLLGTLLVAMVVCALLNAFIERVAYRRLRHAPRVAPLISAIGVSFILINAGLHWKGASQVYFPDLLPNVDILRDVVGIQTPVRFALKDLFVIAIAVPLAFGLTQFIQRTRLGKAMRATAQDREAASMMGIDINTTIMLTFLLGGALAGAAGLMYGLYNNTAWFFQGFRSGLYAFTAAVMGGIGNVQGALLGGLLIGILGAVSDRLIDPRWTQAVVFGLLILILVFRPSGLLGDEAPPRS